MPDCDRTPADSWMPLPPGPLCWDEPFLLVPVALPVEQGSGQEPRRRTRHGVPWLCCLLAPAPPHLPPCARVCCLHGAWRQLQELCSFPVLCLRFLLGIMNRTCLVLSPWLQHHLSTGLRPRLVPLDVSQRSQTWNKVFSQTCC